MGVKGKRFSDRSFFDRSFLGRSFLGLSFLGFSWGEGRSGSKLRASAKAAVPLISVFALGACALHPLQQDVTGLPTVLIVNHIRCETRVAIQLKAIEELKASRHGPSVLSDRMEATLGKVWDGSVVNPARDLSPTEFALFSRYIETAVAFNFTFDVTEENKAALAADPVRLITNGTAGIGLNSSGDFMRNNTRTFIISETFARLLHDRRLECDSGSLLPENFAYPVAGAIGMAELIDTFINLNEDDTLIPSGGGSGGGSKGASGTKAASGSQSAGSSGTMAAGSSSSGSGVFADTLTFTTTLIGGATPSVQINPVGHKWGLASPTSFAATVTRTDKHMLQIGLSLASPAETIKTVVVGTHTIINPSAVHLPSALQKSPSRIISPAEQRALDAMTQQRLDNFLNRFGTVVPAQ